MLQNHYLTPGLSEMKFCALNQYSVSFIHLFVDKILPNAKNAHFIMSCFQLLAIKY